MGFYTTTVQGSEVKLLQLSPLSPSSLKLKIQNFNSSDTKGEGEGF